MPATPRPRGAPRSSSSAACTTRPAAGCCGAIATAARRSPPFSTTMPCSSRGCSISTRPSSTGATWNSPCALPKNSGNCLKTPNPEIPAFLDDYAMFVQGLLDLYEAQFDRRYLELAVRLTEKQRELFEDTESGALDRKSVV